MEEDGQPTKEEVREKLRAKIGEKRIQRSSRVEKKRVLDETFNRMGIDIKEVKEAIKILQKSTPQQRERILSGKMQKAVKTDLKKLD